MGFERRRRRYRVYERIITDDSIERVVVVLDRVYAEKADGRKGGVGTETQIITPQIYKKVRDQNKFVCVIPETDAEGKPYLPAYYQSRLYIDLSKEEIFCRKFRTAPKVDVQQTCLSKNSDWKAASVPR
jgi:hypothetical protein